MHTVKVILPIALLGVTWFSAFRAARLGRIAPKRTVFIALFALAITIVAFASYLVIEAPLIPAELKGGNFGYVAGTIMGSFVLNGVLAAMVLGRQLSEWRQSEPNSSSKPTP
jgi:hypothetical protein